MLATFEVTSNDLNADFLAVLRSFFKNSDKLSVTVQECPDTTGYLLSSEANRSALMESLEQYKAGKVTEHALYEAE